MTPVLVLTKSDACDDPDRALAVAQEVAAGAEVIRTSAITGEGLERLDALLVFGETVALVGSSGVGKSTLVNRWLGGDRQLTNAVREDGRGQHTTTRRSLFRLRSGALVIDTPGLRELGVSADEDALDAVFADVETYAAACRFRDCTHGNEPGCAVREAVASGALDPDRVAARAKLAKEAAWHARRSDPLAQAAEKARWKSISKSIKRLYRDGK